MSGPESMTMAEIQLRIQHLMAEGENSNAAIREHGATLTSARNRLESITSLVENASKVLGKEDPELHVLKDVFLEETRFWVRRSTEASPALQRAYAALDATRKELDAFQNQIRPRLVELDAERAAATKGAIGNPPGASPSLDTRS